MLASVGIAYTASGGPLFAGPVALDGTTFASLGSDPWTAFAALPYQGKLQMLIVIGLLEFHSEIPSGGQKHYLNGGTPGKIMVGGFPLFDPIGFMGSMSQEKKDAKLVSEIKNGRLAMLAITGYAFQEFLWGTPVVDQTPIFFTFFGDILAPGALGSLGLFQ